MKQGGGCLPSAESEHPLPSPVFVMASVQLDLDATGIDRMIQVFNPQRVEKTLRGALKYAGAAARTASGKEIGARYGIASARIKSDIGPVRVTPNEATISFARKRPPTLRAFSGRPLARGGISAAIFRGERWSTKTAFFLPVASAPAPGIPFIRTGTGRKDIRPMYGPSIGSIFARDSRFGNDIRSAVGQRMSEAFTKGVDRELARQARGF